MTRIRAILLAVGFAGLFVVWGLAWTAKHIERIGSGIAPLKERVFDGFQVITLGTGADRINHNRAGPSIGIALGSELILVDAGAGLVGSMRAAEIPARQPTSIILTSILPENFVGLDDFLMARAQEGATNALHIMGPPGSKKTINRLWKGFEAALDLQTEIMVLQNVIPPVVSEIKESESFTVGSFKLDTINVGQLTANFFAYRVWQKEKSVLVAGRAHDNKRLITFGQDCDFWFQGAHVREALEAAIDSGASEATRREARSWIALEDLGALATQMNVRAVALTRLTPPPIFDFQYKRLVGRTFARPVFVAKDGDVFSP